MLVVSFRVVDCCLFYFVLFGGRLCYYRGLYFMFVSVVLYFILCILVYSMLCYFIVFAFACFVYGCWASFLLFCYIVCPTLLFYVRPCSCIQFYLILFRDILFYFSVLHCICYYFILFCFMIVSVPLFSVHSLCAPFLCFHICQYIYIDILFITCIVFHARWCFTLLSLVCFGCCLCSGIVFDLYAQLFYVILCCAMLYFT